MVKVKIDVDQVKLLAIHTQNSTYPILTAKASRVVFETNLMQDHDEMKGHLGNFTIYDNTNHPFTVDPRRTYPKAR